MCDVQSVDPYSFFPEHASYRVQEVIPTLLLIMGCPVSGALNTEPGASDSRASEWHQPSTDALSVRSAAEPGLPLLERNDVLSAPETRLPVQDSCYFSLKGFGRFPERIISFFFFFTCVPFYFPVI